ncbi:UDP-N-acetylglucosamine--N-acetylmuramyl-(pentapeptide) pyrophosphoryl-undecaprenol N-acetylglucosamine transferase [Patescibacteria group bacterium]|nr:UDP-N-acetylglucosamine--N-acetylmuramyl-(pentapeptide) pyrophosphoryl-undecaprenol N-acetylglucosamine transferase [Patescibacteria group bacterium]
MATILFAGGGSIGHIAPAVAVARSLKELKPDVNVRFICSNREEDAEFLTREGFDFIQIDAPRLSLTFPWRFFSAYKKSSALLKEMKPDIIFSKGGYVSVPVCLAAHKKKIPIILHESDAVSGYANRLVSRWAEVVCLGFPQTTSNVQRRMSLDVGRWTFTNNPIRSEITQGNREEGLRITHFSGNKPILIVMGGSQGAQALNEAVAENLEELLKLCDIIHLTGEGKMSTQPRDGYWVREFAHEELAHLYAISTFALSRAGAGSIAELEANNIPTILVPLEGAAHNHQLKNAEAAAKSGQFTVLRQHKLKGQLVDIVNDTFINRGKLTVNCQMLTVDKDASRQIAEILFKYLA